MNDRILALINYLGISVSEFERSCGLSNGAVSKMGDNTRIATLDRISKIYPQVNMTWLRIGEGNMINDEKRPFEDSHKEERGIKEKNHQIEYIRLLPLYAQGGSLNDFSAAVSDYDCEMLISPVKGASFAMQVSGDSMSPEYPNGSRIIIKKIDETSFIEWGRVYVLDTNNGSVIKIIVPSDREDCVRCLSINKDPIYAPFDVPKSSINGIYRVMMCMAMK